MNPTLPRNWIRVTRREPCPICKKFDWCTVGTQYVCCMRVSSEKPARNGGWLHSLGTKVPAPLPTRPRPEPQSVNCTEYLRNCHRTATHTLDELAISLGLPTSALLLLDVVWDKHRQAWAWPMFDAWLNCVGVRFRDDTGRKWSLTGSHNGLFLPRRLPEELCVICEGPTDTAAALAMGFYAIGRPSCAGLENEIARFLTRQDVRRAIIIGDNDEVRFKAANGRDVSPSDHGNQGYTGAVRLSQVLKIPTSIAILPTKDLRGFYQMGGTAQIILALTGNLLWNVPRVTK